ncbi:hypothetical protein C8J57DRAFT_1468002 [Mycena rebaudengoi]|nr:hypothetical protein C8J57DRAFT_1468002 [Mycena rebaudengoi]
MTSTRSACEPVRVRWRSNSPEPETEPPTFAPSAISPALARMRLVFAPGGDAASFGERGARVVRKVELGGIAGSACATFYAMPNSRHTSGAKRAAAAARCCDSGRTPANEDGCETPREYDTHTRKDGGEDEKQ